MGHQPVPPSSSDNDIYGKYVVGLPDPSYSLYGTTGAYDRAVPNFTDTSMAYDRIDVTTFNDTAKRYVSGLRTKVEAPPTGSGDSRTKTKWPATAPVFLSEHGWHAGLTTCGTIDQLLPMDRAKRSIDALASGFPPQPTRQPKDFKTAMQGLADATARLKESLGERIAPMVVGPPATIEPFDDAVKSVRHGPTASIPDAPVAPSTWHQLNGAAK